MRCTLRLGKACAFLLIFTFPYCDVALSTPMIPTPDPAYRDLRDGYVRNWYIYNDQITDGILAPGDLEVETFCNWWTPVSAHTQHNYDDGPYGPSDFYYDGATQDMPSGPMNFASYTNSGDNYWLPMEANTIGFYMSYSQFDNNDFATFSHGGGLTPDQVTMLTERNMQRNGWALGWLTDTIVKNRDGTHQYDGTPAGSVTMDIYVHEGGGDYMANFGADGIGISRSNPQVSMSNDISNLAKEVAGGNPANAQWQPPTFDQAGGIYDTGSTANDAYKAVLGLNNAQFDTVVDSMEIREYDADALGPGDVIYGNKRPSEIEANEVDHNGDPYIYEDAILDRSNYVVSTNDGGVIAGLSGYDDYNIQINNWGDQQVIRIDISPDTLIGEPGAPGTIDKLVFYDFGCDGQGAQQIAPRAIVFNVDGGGNIYYDDGMGGITYFPENRIYIARVVIIPEPSTMVLLSIGGMCAVAARRRRHRSK